MPFARDLLVIRGLRIIELVAARGYLASDEQGRLVQNLARARTGGALDTRRPHPRAERCSRDRH